MERKIGEVFEYNGVKLRVEPEVYVCRGCYFKHDSDKWCTQYKSIRGECQKSSRSDIGIIFKKVGDMEERTIKLTLEKAKEFYKKGGELRDLALSVYTKDELTRIELPRTWEEFCSKVSKKEVESYIGTDSDILSAPYLYRNPKRDRNVLPSQEAAKAHLALMQLHQLRDWYRQGWEPNWSDCEDKYCIVRSYNDTKHLVAAYKGAKVFLSFQSADIARLFLKNFRGLIEAAGDLV